MKKQKGKELNVFLEKTIKAMELEKAPKDFVSSVMQSVAIQRANTPSISYTPLVSKPIWICLAILIAVFFGVLVFESDPVRLDWFSTLKLNIVGNIDFFNIIPTTLSVSDSTIYALAGLLIFMGVQVWYLKRFFAKRQVLL